LQSNQPAKTCEASITNGKFGKDQVFDAQRNPAFPISSEELILSNLQPPFKYEEGDAKDKSDKGQYNLDEGQYIKFFIAGGNLKQNLKEGCNVGIKLFSSSGAEL
jgi:hypothetical protein